MQKIMAVLLAAHTLTAVAAPQPPAATELTAPPLAGAAAPALTDEVIRKAVRDTIAEDPNPQPHLQPLLGQESMLRADTAHARMSAAFDEAKVPDCLHQDALKLQPANIGPIAVVGPYALPWLIAAALRGKCR